MIALTMILLLLVSPTFSAARKTKGPIYALVNAVISAAVVWMLSFGVNWNGQFPIWLWWAIAVWAAALVGLSAARLMRARLGRPRAAAQTAPR
ncbi:hypothetical protein CAFEA_04850 [Corynebacterium afermentans subsp. afermentans]|uniref:Uncharacterized protein n=1 Tax=Corynebacterium afermentans TaxID=38286 RepID=A0A9X8WHD8_9CORY|nr:hypothetical protein CAFEA_04850 [Corynebacterium afermentans subsp. afermentans]SIQ14598.1 hypothetical protein SAMN05421802_10770 [Corynebacterium afermentans]